MVQGTGRWEIGPPCTTVLTSILSTGMQLRLPSSGTCGPEGKQVQPQACPCAAHDSAPMQAEWNHWHWRACR